VIKPILIRQARPDEAGHLSGLAMRSKAYWGYSTDFMEACQQELTVSPEEIESKASYYVVADTGETVVGFYALGAPSGIEVELEALFVEPEFIGQGMGKNLINHAKKQALSLGAQLLTIQGDPHAEIFYLATGCEQVGSRESESIPGRFLPTFNIALSDESGS
jgi:GNAT superfamily N-acetyltransferase